MARRVDRGDPRAPAKRRTGARVRTREKLEIRPERVLRALQGRSRPALAIPTLLRALELPPGARSALRRLLQELTESGQLDRLGARYRLRRSDGLVEGVFSPARGGVARRSRRGGRRSRLASDAIRCRRARRPGAAPAAGWGAARRDPRRARGPARRLGRHPRTARSHERGDALARHRCPDGVDRPSRAPRCAARRPGRDGLADACGEVATARSRRPRRGAAPRGPDRRGAGPARLARGRFSGAGVAAASAGRLPRPGARAGRAAGAGAAPGASRRPPGSARQALLDHRSRDRARSRRRGLRGGAGGGRVPALGGDRGRRPLRGARLAARPRGAAPRQQRLLPRPRDSDASRNALGRSLLAAAGGRPTGAGGRARRRAFGGREPAAPRVGRDPKPGSPRLRRSGSRDGRRPSCAGADRRGERAAAWAAARGGVAAREAEHCGLDRLRPAERRNRTGR